MRQNQTSSVFSKYLASGFQSCHWKTGRCLKNKNLYLAKQMYTVSIHGVINIDIKQKHFFRMQHVCRYLFEV